MVRSHRSPAPAGRRSRVFAAIVAALLFAAPSPAQTVERDMFVTVLDKNEKPVLTLGVPDFVVREDGRVREVWRKVPPVRSTRRTISRSKGMIHSRLAGSPGLIWVRPFHPLRTPKAS